MTKRNKERKFKVIVTNPDEPLDPAKIKLFAEWLVDFGIRVGTIPDPHTGKTRHFKDVYD